VTPLEKSVQREVVTFFEGLGCRVYRLSQPRRTMQTPGLPDLWAFCPRKRLGFWWETKRVDGGTRRPEQERFAELCTLSGVPYGYGAMASARAFAKALGLTWEAAA